MLISIYKVYTQSNDRQGESRARGKRMNIKKLTKIGNSHYVLISSAILKTLSIKPGAALMVSLDRDKIVIHKK